MAPERQDYPAMLSQLQPGQAVDVLNDRVRQAGKLNTAIADWLQERRRLEEQYSSGLRRLSKKPLEDADLGIFSVPWATLTESANTLADSHSTLASKIEIDVERPLREFVNTSREMSGMTTIQGNLNSMAKDVEKAQQKTEKLKGRGAEDSRVASANYELENAQSQWQAQAPYVFENLQAVDETRFDHLRDVLTQFQTHEVDLVEKSRQTAEHSLNVLLQVETADEIKTFALKTLASPPRPDRARRASLIAAPTPSRSSTTNALTPSISQQDDESQGSISMLDEKKKSRFGGLKRIGTVMGSRKRDSKLPASLPPMSESSEPKERSRPSPFNPLSGRLGRSRDAPTLDPPRESSTQRRPYSPLRIGSELMEPSSRLANEPAAPALQRGNSSSQVNGASAAAGAIPAASAAMLNGHQSDLNDLEPPKPSQTDLQNQTPPTGMTQDSEGFSVRPPELDPISQAQQEAAGAGETTSSAFNVNIRDTPVNEEPSGDRDAALSGIAGKLQAPPPPVQSRAGTIRGRRQARNSMAASALVPSEETPAIPETVPLSMSPPAMSPPIEASRELAPIPASPPLNPGTATLQSPSNMSPSLSGSPSLGQVAASTFSPPSTSGSQSFPSRTDSRFAVGSEPTGDAQSIRSGRSLSSTLSQGTRHPEMTATGLNSSVIETVSARFENGKMLTSSLIGEIALAYVPADFSSPFGSENIRLENFSTLEKVAPNPAFIAQSPNKDGEYTLNLANIAKTQVAFKYQLKSSDTTTQAPLLIATAFKIEANQASVIVSYSLNPSFNLHGRESVTISNVMLGLTLEGALATGCQSKPAGTFSREKNLIYWPLGDVTLRAGAGPEKLLARFATESEAKAGAVEARWEIGGEHAQGLGSGLAVSVQGASGAAGEGGDPFADDKAAAGLTAVWRDVRGARKLVSGNYVAR